MARDIPWMPIIAITGVLTFLFSIVAGIPRIVDFYPSVLSGLFESIPLELVSVWGERVGLLLLGVTIGWYAHTRRLSPTKLSADAIEGCIEVRDVAWKGTGTISDGKIVDVEVPYDAICPECQSPMNSAEVKRSRGGGLPSRSLNKTTTLGSSTAYFWKCPSADCDYSSKKDHDRHDDAVALLTKHFDRITEADDEEYSLNTIIDGIQKDGGEVTPREIWRRYVQIVDDSDVSLKCFPQ